MKYYMFHREIFDSDITVILSVFFSVRNIYDFK